MNKNYRVITINGIRGILTVVFIVFGLIAGFVVSPGWVCMKLWNWCFEQTNYLVFMNLYQGIMLWAIIALSLYALNNKRALIGFGSYKGLSPEQIRDLMIKAGDVDRAIIKDFELNPKDLSFLNKEPKETENINKDSTQNENTEESRR
ncbi:MAG: hypothetical protein LUG16_05315 [Candidatus Gastranaerophilales bacterium]|nr:hypothetical protein [Candidatus Gastranaerophilales bacterium]